ncbi:MAG TPA: dTMP kinase, partial [Thermotogales bacterium]|nr:dTMP kinase [Thermotogales bacterium]
MEGRFITFEGIDGSGKSTQVELLSKYLEALSIDHLIVREPGGTDVGEKIREILLSKGVKMTARTEFLLYSASRANLTEKIIIPALREGKIVISDRYFDSSTAYQGFGRGIEMEYVDVINRFATFGLMPDITFIIDVRIETSIERKNLRDRIESEGLEFLERVRKAYLEMAEKS